MRVIIGLIDQFCKEHLNEEYAVLCRKLAEKLARKRPSPLLHGSPNAWASGIVRSRGLGQLPARQEPDAVHAVDRHRPLPSAPAQAAGRRSWRRSARCSRFTRLTRTGRLPSRLDDNPMVWMLQVNGFMMDVRHAPREVQEIAFNKGLIPYIPADRQRQE